MTVEEFEEKYKALQNEGTVLYRKVSEKTQPFRVGKKANKCS